MNNKFKVKFYLNFIKNLLLNNKIKLLLLLLGLILIHYGGIDGIGDGGKFKDDERKIVVKDSLYYMGKYVYIGCKIAGSSERNEIVIDKLDKPLPIKNGVIEYKIHNPLNEVSIIVGWVIFIISLIACIFKDDDTNLSINKVLFLTYLDHIDCEYENNKQEYFYYIKDLNRLLFTSPNPHSHLSLMQMVENGIDSNIINFSKLNTLPYYEGLRLKRENNLKNLGI